MPAYGDCRTADVPASPQACFDALTAFEALPSWQGAVKDVQVLERDGEGRGTVVESTVDATSSWTCGSTPAASCPARCAPRSPTR